MTQSKVEQIIGRLELLVEFEELPDLEDLRMIVQDLKGHGKVVKAKLGLTRDVMMDLKEGL